MITVLPYEPGHRDRWNRFIETSKNGHFMFHRDYMEYHADRFEDASLMFELRGRLVGILPGHRRQEADGVTALVSHSGLSFGGVICGRSMRVALMSDLFDALVAFSKEKGWGRLIYKAIPHIYHQYPAEEDLFALLSLGGERIDTKLSCACLTGSSPRPGKTRVRRIELAKKSGLEIVSVTDIEAFHEMHAAWLAKRHGAQPVHSAEELRLLADRFPQQMRVFGARQGDKLVAAEMVFESPTCVRFQFAASTDEGFALNANHLITRYLMEHLARPGQWVDFGTSMDPETGELERSLIASKESFGARALLQDTYQLEIDG